MLSHDCDIDKPRVPTALVATLVRADGTDPGLLNHIVRGQVWHALWLEDEALGAWVNLRTIRPVSKSELAATLESRSCGASDDEKLAIAQKIFQFFSHSLPTQPAEIVARPPNRQV